ncbi:hypothetical protein DMA12_18385 [Amycolatopsis balhimycina DSM 5908]|uniref:Uncharacterized protein n=1 Tax=Amycolatopsis balhimycina DSM 5908 TaxID=1081091 RepID=A0A428WLA3_AMYBA|nr:hypothetical protein [Amycolatopsis balhimycina]RSM43833.1 hypothetical protein DMA12_18385 [Amycolatopsis balhimycina DSM 5908]
MCTEYYDLDPAVTFTADCIRAADSPNRRTAIKGHGAVREHVMKVSPVWDWRVRHVRAALADNRCPLPIDYEWFNCSFDGPDFRFLDPIRRNAPPITPESWTGSRWWTWRCSVPNSDNDDLLAQLSAQAAPVGAQSNEDSLAQLNAAPEPDPWVTSSTPETSRRTPIGS